ISLMRHHTATHIIMGAARRVLGEHVWQAGTQKDIRQSRLDITHPKRLTKEEISRIEELANEAVMENMLVEITWMPREKAERIYGFRLYQGGVVPGREIRVVKIDDWEVEACGGTHCKSTGDVGAIKILRTERIQDGVERIIFSAGLPAVRRIQEIESKIIRISELIDAQLDRVDIALEKIIDEWRNLRRERDRLVGKIARIMAEKYLLEAKDIGDLKLISKLVSGEEANIDLLIGISNEIVKSSSSAIVVLIHVDKEARAVVKVGDKALKDGIQASEVARRIGQILGGGGSGRADFAQAGGPITGNALKALEETEAIIYRIIVEREK
ncbi:MAG: DHHA1 domain-containing protein, partial [Thermoproteota archaeon]